MQKPDAYYEDFDAKKYDRILVRDGYVAQGREINNIQSQAQDHIAQIAAALFADGDLIDAGQIIVSEYTGHVRAQAGKIFLAGKVREVPEAEFTIPIAGIVTVGVYLTETVVSEMEDPSLRNPAIGNRGEGEPGAWRLKVSARWGFSGDGGAGTYYPVHTVEDGITRIREAPPQLDAFTQSIAKYDRDSTGGGSYVVSGLTVLQAPDTNDGKQMYTVAEGRARVSGNGIELATSRRLAHHAKADIRHVDTEVIISTGTARQRVDIARPPAANYTNLRITKKKTVDILHGAYAGAMDDLPDTSIVEIVECRQGETVYEKESEYKKTGDSVDWSLPGNEPSPGSSYTVTYKYIAQIEPEEPDHLGFYVTDAEADKSIMVNYDQQLTRFDRICLTPEGAFVFVTGVGSARNPRVPTVPSSMLPIATIHQTWTDERTVENDGVRVVPFSDIVSIKAEIDEVRTEVARQRLEADVSTREGGARKGVYVDPLLDDSGRDQGFEQSAAVIDGELTLPITANISGFADDVAVPTSNAYTSRVALDQPLQTGSMKINPYMAYDRLPGSAKLTPAVDQWTQTETAWTSAITQRLNTGSGKKSKISGVSTSTQVASVTTTALEFLREIDVAFELAGFGPGEFLDTITFDGMAVTVTGTGVADANGIVRGSFTIPPRVPAGAKLVSFTGRGGTTAEATFVGQGDLQVTTLRSVTTVTTRFYDPVAQSFVMEEDAQLTGFDVWFTAKGTSPVTLQLREMLNGYPSRTILAEKQLTPDKLVVTGGGHTRFTFDNPVDAPRGSEYAFVLLCNDADAAIAVAELGKFDARHQRHVTAQPYTVGVLFSSSNASTWTAHQDKDMTFRVLVANYDSNTRDISLGETPVSGATDIMLLSIAETPAAATRVEYELTMPEGESLVVSENQPVRLAAPINGKVKVKAKLEGTANTSPMLWPGSQFVAGVVKPTADYVSRAVQAYGGTKAIVIYDAYIPSGASVTPSLRQNQGAYEPVTGDGTTMIGDGWVEYRFLKTELDADTVQLKLDLTGTVTARPSVSNIRILVV